LQRSFSNHLICRPSRDVECTLSRDSIGLANFLRPLLQKYESHNGVLGWSRGRVEKAKQVNPAPGRPLTRNLPNLPSSSPVSFRPDAPELSNMPSVRICPQFVTDPQNRCWLNCLGVLYFGSLPSKLRSCKRDWPSPIAPYRTVELLIKSSTLTPLYGSQH